ncbi:MAG: AAA family ATPase [Acholeplasma sp.]|jgi:hypothetical protein|nr:AAA family ATPase [Acholeplasma sp.]
MKNKQIKRLILILVMILVIGTLLMISISQNPNLIDRSIILSTAQMLFVLGSALVLVLMLFVILLSLNTERKQLNAFKLAYDQVHAEEDKQDVHITIEQQSDETPEVPEEETDETSRFFMLTQIDEKAKAFEFTREDDITLERLCDEFRHFAASQLRLYYDISDIRRFIGGLSVSHIMILQGMSGTGKTSLAYAFGEYLKNSTVVVPIQPMWKERTDLIGYYNEFTKKFNETTLLQKLYEASHNEQMYITVLDEMNIARVEYYFAEFLSLLEIPDTKKRHLDVVTDVWDTDPELLKDGKLILPNNMWFVGTANNDDSTFSISDKVYDRAMVINLDKKAKPFIPREVKGRSVSSITFEALVSKARKEYELSQRNLKRIKQLDQYLMTHFHITFGNRIMQQIRNYVPVIVACGGSELSALDDIMSKKVLRKLETKNMVYVKSAAPGLITFMEELFGEGEMLLCKEYIQNIEINA